MTVVPTAINSPETRAVLHYWRTRTLGSQIETVVMWVVSLTVIAGAFFGLGAIALFLAVALPVVAGFSGMVEAAERGGYGNIGLAQGMSRRVLASVVARKALYYVGGMLVVWLAMLVAIITTAAMVGMEVNNQSSFQGISFSIDSSGLSWSVNGPQAVTFVDGLVTEVATQPQWWIVGGGYLVLTGLTGVYAGTAVSLVFHSCANLPAMVRPVIITATFVGLLVATYLCLVPVTVWAFAKAMQQFNQSRAISAAS